MANQILEDIYRSGCCDILPSSEDFFRMKEIGVIYDNGDMVHIYADPEPEEEQCKFRCLRESSRILDEHMTRMSKLTREKKDIERKERERRFKRWNEERAKGRQKKSLQPRGVQS